MQKIKVYYLKKKKGVNCENINSLAIHSNNVFVGNMPSILETLLTQ